MREKRDIFNEIVREVAKSQLPGRLDIAEMLNIVDYEKAQITRG